MHVHGIIDCQNQGAADSLIDFAWKDCWEAIIPCMHGSATKQQAECLPPQIRLSMAGAHLATHTASQIRWCCDPHGLSWVECNACV